MAEGVAIRQQEGLLIPRGNPRGPGTLRRNCRTQGMYSKTKKLNEFLWETLRFPRYIMHGKTKVEVLEKRHTERPAGAKLRPREGKPHPHGFLRDSPARERDRKNR